MKQAPAKSENSSLVRALFVQIRKLTHALGQLTAMQKALAASSVDLPQDDELEEVKQALQNRLTDQYSLDFTRYCNRFVNELKPFQDVRANAIPP